MREFDGKVAIVTGGSLGIGRAAAKRLAEGGASVVVCGAEPEPVERTVSELRSAGLEVQGRPANVALSRNMQDLAEFTAERYGGIDILVNSAGIQRYGTVVDTDEEVWDAVLDINLKGIYLAAKYAIPEMRKRGGGVIINVSSVQAFVSQKGVAAYAASKGGINALTRSLAVDHAAENIRVNAVCPASVDTAMLRWAADLVKGEKTADQIIEDWGRMHPIGRVGTPEEVAELIVFLASPRASFITGGEYKIDGGLLATVGVSLPE